MRFESRRVFSRAFAVFRAKSDLAGASTGEAYQSRSSVETPGDSPRLQGDHESIAAGSWSS
ncbi:MAG: hypothetical protein O3A00_07565 [Planctomycetota bacterium]|nr:hypothetical protein [Planctomycetota bacterium]